MHLGYASMNNLHQGRPDETARALEERGFESLWIGEHAHIPAHGRTPYPAGGEMPEHYKHMADPFVSLIRVWCYPKPLQKPWPPIYLGVAGKIGTSHAVEWADAWFPIDAGGKDFGPKLERFRNALKEAGRDPAKVPVSVVPFGNPTLDNLKRYRDLGIERVVINGGDSDESNKLPLLDHYAQMIPALK